MASAVQTPHFRGFLELQRLTETPPMAVIQEAYVHAISMRSFDDLVRAISLEDLSKTHVSRLCGEIIALVRDHLGSPLRVTGALAG